MLHPHFIIMERVDLNASRTNKGYIPRITSLTFDMSHISCEVMDFLIIKGMALLPNLALYSFAVL